MTRDRPLIADPYEHALRRSCDGRLVAVLDLAFDDKPYQLIENISRAVSAGSVHELICTDDDPAPGGRWVRHVSIIGFVEFEKGGIVAVGDEVRIAGRPVGRVAGFDESHAPNHINIMMHAVRRTSGFDLAARVEDPVVISRNHIAPDAKDLQLWMQASS